MVEEREQRERIHLQIGKVTATVMSVIREHLGLEIPEDEKKYIDFSVLQYSDLTPDYIKASLKYLSADFSPQELLSSSVSGYHWQRGIVDWVRVRHAIIAVVDGESHWDIIPSAYYGFKNEEFFFDENVTNPQGVNHTSWKKVTKPVLKREVVGPVKEEQPVRLSWWQRWVECRRC
jgi:hypothetical protein